MSGFSIADIRAASQRLAGKVVRTPVLNSSMLDQAAGCEIFVKAESLQKTGAGGVLEEEQANRVQSSIYTEAATRGVTIARLTPNRSLSQTNAFFDEVSMTVEVLAGEGELVDFLHSLGAGDSMIRVRELNRLRLDPSQTRLQATMTLVASFQKKPKAPVAPPTYCTPGSAAMMSIAWRCLRASSS